MERVQQPDGATSGVRVQPLSKGIGEGTVQLHPFPHVGSGPPAISELGSSNGWGSASIPLWLAKEGESGHWEKRLRLV
jgi:hypothetical protein